MGVARAGSGGAPGGTVGAGGDGGGGGAGAAAPSGAATTAIPSTARKTVQSIKEIVGNSDDEIYAMLKECNMDLNETVQRLLSQDPFHEVKRKRDKKKGAREAPDTKPRGTGFSARGGRSGGRGASVSRYNSNEYSGGGRGRNSARENGVYPKSSGVQAMPPSTAPSAPPSSQPSPLPPVQNEPSYFRPPSAPQGVRPAGHATMADILKSNGAPQPSPASLPSGVPPLSASSGVYPSPTDPVVERPLDSGTNKKDVGPVGNQLSHNELGLAPETKTSLSRTNGASSPPIVDQALEQHPALLDSQALESGVSSASAAAASGPSPSRVRPQQPPVGTHKSTGTVQEWKAKPSTSLTVGSKVTSGTDRPRPPPEMSDTTQSSRTSKLEGFTVPEDQSVIIHNQFLVSADLGLNFGSLSFGSDDDSMRARPSEVDAAQAVDELVDQPSSSVMNSDTTSLNHNYALQQTSAMVDNLPSNSEVTAVSMATLAMSQPELSKPDGVVQQAAHYPYYPGFGLMAQPGTQYSYEPTDSQASDISRLSTLQQQYSDPTASYYTPAFRPGVDGDIRYPFLTSKSTGNKYSGNMTGQAVASESGNSMSTNSLPQTSQPGNAQAAPTMPQQPLPVHAYSAQPGVHLGYNMFNYQYLPQSYPYMHAPYQHSFSGNSTYPQPPAASNYPPPGSNYGAKYPVTQYKPATATSTMHSASAAGYAGYSSSPTGYAANPTVSIGAASVYDDVGGPQYKDSNLYMQNQQAEGSQLWLSRDSFYNIPGQGQHTAYAQQHHAHPAAAYASLYHPTQSVAAPNSHQMLQQPQALGTAAAGGAQAGAYAQQPQRAQQTWSNNY